MPFSTRITVRFGDTDPAGLVYYANIFHYFHIALEEFFAARCGISYQKLLTDERIGFPTVKTETQFSAPLVYGDSVDVEIFVSETRNSSATFEYSARRASDGMLCARATQIHVAMNIDARRALRIPDKYRRAFDESAR